MTDSSEPELPRRELVGLEFLTPEYADAVRTLLTCDCGTLTDLTIKVDGPMPGSVETAFTCDGCSTSHWFRLNATGPGEIS